MIRGGLAGTGSRGGKGAIDAGDDNIGGDWTYFRSGLYIWGLQNVRQLTVGANVFTGAGGADKLRVYPHIFPRAGTIGRIGWFQGPQATGAEGYGIRFGIYSNTNGDKLQRPGSLLSDSGTFSSWPGVNSGLATNWRTWTANLSVDAMSLLWLGWHYNAALQANATGQTMSSIDSDHFGSSQLMGYIDPTVLYAGDTQYRSPAATVYYVGYKHDQAFGAMPSEFPNTSLIRLAPGVSSMPTTDGNAQWAGKVPMILFEWTPA